MGDYAHAWRYGTDGRWHRVVPTGRHDRLACGAAIAAVGRRYWIRGTWPPGACETCASMERRWHRADVPERDADALAVAGEEPPGPGRWWARRPRGAWHLVVRRAAWLMPLPAYERPCQNAVLRPPLVWVRDTAEGIPRGACQQCHWRWRVLHGYAEETREAR